MVSRYLIHCRGCGKRLVLRIQISAGLSPDDPRTAQPFLFACPACRSGMHGALHGGQLSPSLAGEDFDVADGEAAADDLVVSIATDVPVHASLTGGRADDVLLTPYIKVVAMIGPEVAAEVVEAVGTLRGLREAGLPYLRRGVDRYLEGDESGAIEAAAAAFEYRPAEVKLELRRSSEPSWTTSTGRSAVRTPSTPQSPKPKGSSARPRRATRLRPRLCSALSRAALCQSIVGGCSIPRSESSLTSTHSRRRFGRRSWKRGYPLRSFSRCG